MQRQQKTRNQNFYRQSLELHVASSRKDIQSVTAAPLSLIEPWRQNEGKSKRVSE